MTERQAEAVWNGPLKDGSGVIKLGSGAYEGPFSWASRFEDAPGTNPEELLGAAHAGCYSMALSSNLGKAGFTPQHIHTRAVVTIERVDGQNRITHILLDSEARVAGISEKQFQAIAEQVKLSCPISAALASVPVTLIARRLT